MKNSFRFFAALAIMASFARATAFAQTETSEPSLRTRVISAVNYENQFQSIRDLLSDARRLQLLNSEEFAAIEQFMKDKKIDRDAALAYGKIDDSQAQLTVRWPNTSLTLQADGSIKTSTGRILRPSSNQTADQLFMQTYNSLHEQMSARELFLNRMLPSAHADDHSVDHSGDQASEDFGAGFMTVLSYLGRGLLTVAAVPGIAVCGLTAVPAYALQEQVRELAKFRHVRCIHGNFYRVSDTGVVWGMQEDYHFERWRETGHKPLTLSTEIDSAFYATCSAPIDRLDPRADDVKRDRMIPLSRDYLAMAYRHKQPPKTCNKASAAVVEVYAREQQRKMEEELNKANEAAAAAANQNGMFGGRGARGGNSR